MPNEILTRAIDEVCTGTHLTADHASAVLDEIMEGRTSDVETGAFLVALRAKGETVAELVGLARTMRRLAAHVEVERDDLVGGPEIPVERLEAVPWTTLCIEDARKLAR